MKRTAYVVVGLVAISLLIGLLWSSPVRMKGMSLLLSNAAHLKTIGACCTLYALEHAGAFPDDWSDLSSLLHAGESVFVAPGNADFIGSMTNVMEWTDYVYIRGLTTNEPPRTVLAYLPPGHYPEVRKTVVLFVGGDVEFYTLKDFTKLMNEPQQSAPRVSGTRGTPAAYAPDAPGNPER